MQFGDSINLSTKKDPGIKLSAVSKSLRRVSYVPETEEYTEAQGGITSEPMGMSDNQADLEIQQRLMEEKADALATIFKSRFMEKAQSVDFKTFAASVENLGSYNRAFEILLDSLFGTQEMDDVSIDTTDIGATEVM